MGFLILDCDPVLTKFLDVEFLIHTASPVFQGTPEEEINVSFIHDPMESRNSKLIF